MAICYSKLLYSFTTVVGNVQRLETCFFCGLDEIRPHLGRQDVQQINPRSKHQATSDTPTLRSFIHQLFQIQGKQSMLGRSVIAAAFIAASTVSGVSYGQSAEQLDRIQDMPALDGGGVSTTFKAARENGGRLVRVVVILSADSVATARSKVVSKKIGAAETDAVEKAAIAQQASIKPLLVAKGAKILAQYQHALNGVKIDVEKSKIAELAALPGVVSVLPVGLHDMSNVRSVPFVGAPAVWSGVPGFRGENVKIAIIDTGIDYTHANFGGPGTIAAFNAAAATSTAPANPAYYGPGSPKVKGGIDLVGDSYNANPNDAAYQPTPHPDPNPLDCNGHGSHTAGTAAGLGVLNNATYTGQYNTAAYSQPFTIGPGVAPKADLYAVRVFGCAGSTDVVTDAIDWAVANNMDVISMSLGSDYGVATSSDSVASQNAANAGITVVAASGNSGPAPYITSSPGAGNAVIVAAAMDGTASIAGVTIALNTGVSILAQNSNLAPLPSGSLPIYVLRNTDGSVSFGCSESEYVDATIRGKLIVAVRGSTCARIDRATFGQRHGAAAVALINNAAGYPPIEGPIPNVTIPFMGVLTTDQAKLLAATSATLSPGTIANPGFETTASFSSGGPRFGDSAFKPSVAAPGVSVFSTLSGSGTGGLFESGTSMSTPHVAGVAALVRQAHPGWSELAQRAAIVQTADRVQKLNYSPRLDGSGVLQAVPAVGTQAVVLGTLNNPEPLSFGFTEFTGFSLNSGKTIDVRNNGTTAVTFNVKATPAGGATHIMGLASSTVTVPPLSDTTLAVKLAVQASNVGLTHPAGTTNAFRDVAGTLTFTPTSSTVNGGATLTVPYYMVTRVRSLIAVSHNVPSNASPSATLTVTNPGAQVPGTADFYAWGLQGTPQANDYNIDTRAVGVQSFQATATDYAVVFAVNTFKRVSNFAPTEFDIALDIDGDGQIDYYVIGTNVSSFVSSQPSGRFASAVYNARTGALGPVRFADSPTDSTTFLLTVLASEMGLSASKPRFRYQLTSYAPDGTSYSMPGIGAYNVFNPAISTGQFVTVPPNGTATVPVAINAAERALTPMLGVMAVSMDNLNGVSQADLIPVP